MKQVRVYLDILAWIMDRIERQPELGEIVSSMRVELGRLDVWMAEREDRFKAEATVANNSPEPPHDS